MYTLLRADLLFVNRQQEAEEPRIPCKQTPNAQESCPGVDRVSSAGAPLASLLNGPGKHPTLGFISQGHRPQWVKALKDLLFLKGIETESGTF
jgi:hypothetical protein